MGRVEQSKSYHKYAVPAACVNIVHTRILIEYQPSHLGAFPSWRPYTGKPAAFICQACCNCKTNSGSKHDKLLTHVPLATICRCDATPITPASSAVVRLDTSSSCR